MFSGHNFIGYNTSSENDQKIKVFSTLHKDYLPGEFSIASRNDVETATEKAHRAFEIYKRTPAAERAAFLETIADEIGNIGEELIQRAAQETGLPKARLEGERARTIGQLRLFASILKEGSWVQAVLDAAQPDRQPIPQPDVRKMLVPIGPVLVFGASNFPLAFSTAGGDTASALAAGCPVIVKAHSSHLGTNELVTRAILTAAEKCAMPDGVFSSLIGEGSKVGQALAKNPRIKAIGFTGSFKAGMALFKTATTERETPIPVYAEMSSINPVLILPGKLKQDCDTVATQLAASITLGVGQFCTNPGLLFVMDGADTNAFLQALTERLIGSSEATMLNRTVCSSYYTGREHLAKEKGVKVLHVGNDLCSEYKGSATLMEVSAQDFINNPQLQEEVFGPCSLIVKCADRSQMLEGIRSLRGQLTGTVFATSEEISGWAECVNVLSEKVGRLIYNNVPTGVEVCHAMVHGGPFPATTDVRFTSVGADAITRFVRPVCFQNFPEEMLPEELKSNNPLGIMRKVNGEYTRVIS